MAGSARAELAATTVSLFFRVLPEKPTLSSGADAHGTDERRIIALRVWMEPATSFQGLDAGGLHGPPLLGQAGAIAAGYQVNWLALCVWNLGEAISAVPSTLLDDGLLLPAAVVVLTFLYSMGTIPG